MFRELSEFYTWFEERSRANTYRVDRVGLDDLDDWSIEAETGNIVHRTGRFFAVEGLWVHVDPHPVETWDQPIIVQPENGILGILVKDFDGIPHCLMQAKMEPGNVNVLQLSPTVQATRSNFTRVHRGSSVPYLEYFTAPRRHRVIFDSLQSEQGSWFLGKRNRNMIVRVDGDVPVREDFCWLSLPQLAALLREDNVVNMDSRTVLSGMPGGSGGDGSSALDAEPDGQHTMAEIISWFTEAKTSRRLDRYRMPLSKVRGWAYRDGRVAHERDRYFEIIGVRVQASNREVRQWCQPMLAPRGRGVIAFLTREIDGVRHVLVHALTEAGTHDVVEMAPTVQCDPDNYRDAAAVRRPLFLDYVLSAPRQRCLLDVVHSEEGGRFYHAENRYLVIESGDDVPRTPPDGYLWVSLSQLARLVRHSNYLNVAARSLLCCLRSSRWAKEPMRGLGAAR